jgi:hypothetical protein
MVGSLTLRFGLRTGNSSFDIISLAFRLVEGWFVWN